MMGTSVVNWNVAWARPNSVRGREILRRIWLQDPQVICLTEGHTDFLPRDGHLICSHADYGYRAQPTRRKVLLWSKQPWHGVDNFGHDSMPPGRFVAGTTLTDAGLIRFIGVCIPWRDAHVRSGRKDREPWEDHLAHLRGLVAYLKRVSTSELVVLGDFNQTIPRSSAPHEAWASLSDLFGVGLVPATSGLRGNRDKATIDHVAVGAGVKVVTVGTLSNEGSDGLLSDHFGIKAVIARGDSSCEK